MPIPSSFLSPYFNLGRISGVSQTETPMLRGVADGGGGGSRGSGPPTFENRGGRPPRN